MSSVEKNVSDKLLANLSTAADLTRATISEFLQTINENSDDEVISKYGQEFIKISSEYVTALEDLTAEFKVNLDWLPPSCSLTSESHDESHPIGKLTQIEMNYSDGDTPWSFWLSYKRASEFEPLLASIHDQWKNGNLSKLTSLPGVGTSVVCVDRSSVFRGIVLNTYSDKARVRNIDDTCVKVIKLEHIYVMSRKMISVHAQTVHCCLTKDKSYKKLWSSDLCGLFKDTMRECQLKVRFMECLSDEFPPLHLVEMEGHGEAVVNFNQWICITMFEELKNYKKVDQVRLENLPEHVLDPYYVEERGKSGKPLEKRKVHFDEMAMVKAGGCGNSMTNLSAMPWSSQLFVPPLAAYFLATPPTPDAPPMYPMPPVLQAPVGALTTQYTAIYRGLDSNANLYQVPQHVTATSSFIMNQPLPNNSSLNVNTPVFEPRKLIEKPELEMRPNSDVKLPANLPQSEVCPMFSKNGFCLNSSCNKKHVQIKKSPTHEMENKSSPSINNKTEPVLSSNSIKLATTSTSPSPTPMPNGGNSQKRVNQDGVEKDNDKTNNEDFYSEDDDDDYEEPMINGGYMPTDETRLCRFFSKSGKCWKPMCHKEHSMPLQHKWTSDTQTTVQSSFNLLCLPNKGETIELLVTMVRNPYTFYARLPDIYSDIGEGVNNIETFRSLHSALNDSKNVKTYSSPEGTTAGEGELYLALSSDGIWKRARIIESYEKSSMVFYVDYGDEERVSRDYIKTLEDRFLHLPCQGVLCTLYRLFCVSYDRELRSRGKKCLEGLIKGKVISGKVASRNVEESSLELLVAIDGLNINNIMVTRGFCEED